LNIGARLSVSLSSYGAESRAGAARTNTISVAHGAAALAFDSRQPVLTRTCDFSNFPSILNDARQRH